MDAKDKEELRELFLEFFDPFAASIQQNFIDLQQNFTDLQKRMDEGFAHLNGEIAALRKEVVRSNGGTGR